jgi:hypothetical protein
MNKAFVKEADSTEANCPRCGSTGVAVGPITLEAQLDEAALRGIAEQAFFCPAATCDVAYFDAFERVVRCDSLRKPACPKDPTAPLCACFGLTIDDVEADLAEGTPTRVRALLAKAKSPEAHCQTLAASGQSCIAEVQRCYLRMLVQRKGERGT